MDLSSSGSWSRGGLVGRQIGPYQVVDEIARGGQGVVLAVRHLELGYPAALKLLTVVTPQGTARFAQEAQLLARLQHPHIPRLRDHGLMNGVPFIALELVEGPTLKHALGQGLITREQAVEVIEIVADTLEYCHTRGVVHRDLKPSNIVIGEELTPRLLDFGLAKGEQQDQSLSMTGEVVGTPGFMAPEQCGGEVSDRADPRTDVYGLGALLYYALCGVPPHDGASIVNVIKKILEADPVHPREYEPDTPPALSAACLKALAKDPAERYDSAEEFAAALAAWREAPVEISESGRGLVGVLAVMILVGAIGLGVAMASRMSGGGVATVSPSTPSSSAAATDETPQPAPTPSPSAVAEPRPRGEQRLDPNYKIRWFANAPTRTRPAALAVGPWVLAQHGQGWWALRTRDGERVALPAGTAFAWDAGAKRLVFRVEDRIATWDPEGVDAPVEGATVPQAQGVTVAGGVTVVTTLDRKLVGVVGSEVRWSVPVLGRLDAPPAALDLNGDGKEDHLLLATAQGDLALRSLSDGALVTRARVVGPVRHSPLVVGRRSERGSVPVAVVCVDGHVVRLDVTPRSILRRGVVVLHQQVRTAPVLLRRNGRVDAIAFGLGPWGIAAVRVDGSEVAWAEPPPQPGSWATQVAAIDLDEDGQDEVAATWTVQHKESFLTVHAPDGEPLERLPAGEQPWGGVAAAERVLVATRAGRIEAWGWRKRWVRRTRTPSAERARFLLVSGAWSAAKEEAEGFRGTMKSVYTALARFPQEGQAVLTQIMMAEPMAVSAEIAVLLQGAGPGLAGSLTALRFQGGMVGASGPLRMELLPGSAAKTEPLPGDPTKPELQVHKTGIKARGFTTVGISTAQGPYGRHCFVNGGWLGVRLQVATPGRYRLWLRHGSIKSFGWGYSGVGIELNDERVINAWSAPSSTMWESVELPRLPAGEHKVRVRVLVRTATLYTLSGLRIERIP